jgi:uncharacterized membrane protein
MQWFFYALVGQFLYAVGFLIDKYLLEKHFKEKSLGTLLIFGGIFAGLTALAIGLLLPEVLSFSASSILLMTFGGILISLYFFPYFSALADDDASLVAPLFQMLPLFSLGLGYIILGETLTQQQQIGGAVILMGAIGISYDYGKRLKFNRALFVKMLLACFLFSLAAMYFKYFALETDFWAAMFWGNIGTFLFALILFLTIKQYREDFSLVLRNSNSYFFAANAVNEVTYVLASILSLYAAMLGPVALVQTSTGFHSVFVLVLVLLLSLLFPSVIREQITFKHLLIKFFFILLMSLGTYVLYI